jgi:2-polyprenyl-3-methyl-5-hydroxy-6-metoxy-1,4-benzoquinol methylase
MNKLRTAIAVLRELLRPRTLWSAENVKVLAYELAKQRLVAIHAEQNPLAPSTRGQQLGSIVCTSSDWQSEWLPYWAAQMHMQPALHRKIWEFAFIAQVLYERDMLRPERRGLGFGCGKEPLASIFAARGCSVLATDLSHKDARAHSWTRGGQHADSIENVWMPSLCSDELAARNLKFRPVDMNDVPVDLTQGFDFCWSSCALEHLGSIENGLRFIRESARTLAPGGIAVHTTELNLEEGRTLDHQPTVLFHLRHFERLAAELASGGVHLAPIVRRPGDPFLDSYVDTPPYPVPGTEGSTLNMLHLRLIVASFRTTSIGVVLTKAA